MRTENEDETYRFDHDVAMNVRDFYQSLPARSPVKTPVLKQFYYNVPGRAIALYLGVTEASISQALTKESKPLKYFLINLGIPRNRLGCKEIYAMEWFTVYCLVPSGKNRRCYYGTFHVMFFSYYNWCVENGYDYVSPSTLQQLRKRERIWLLKGDIFIDPIIVMDEGD